jgi:hypothetical protein
MDFHHDRFPHGLSNQVGSHIIAVATSWISVSPCPPVAVRRFALL